MEEQDNRLGWWTMSGRAFLDALKRVQEGEDPDFVYLEYYTNSTIERDPSGD